MPVGNTSFNTSQIARDADTLKDAIENTATPYGDLTVVDRDNRISVSAESPLSDQSDTYTSGVSHIPTDSKFRIRANSSTERLETIDSLQYTPGYIAEVGIALEIPEAPTGDQEIRWGYWDGQNGVYFGWDSVGVFGESLRNGTRQGKIRPSEWSNTPDIDAEQALQNGTISRLILALYNFGSLGFELYDRDETNQLESNLLHAQNIDGETTLSKQDNPIRVEVDNPDTTDLDVFVADRQATVRGQFTPNRRIKGERREAVGLSGTTFVPILSFRRKEAFKTINTELFDVSLKPDEDIYIQVREDVGSTTDADYAAPQDVSEDETGVEVDTDPTADITDGYYVYQTQFDGGQNNRSVLGRLEDVDLALKNTRPMTLFARTVSATGGELEAFNLNWAENW